MARRAIALLGLAALVGIGAFTGGKESKHAQADCSDKITAFVMSQTFVKQRLKAPATASFPYSSSDGVSTVESGVCSFRISAYVDSENSFGANLRSNYSMDVRYDQSDKMWHATNILVE